MSLKLLLLPRRLFGILDSMYILPCYEMCIFLKLKGYKNLHCAQKERGI